MKFGRLAQSRALVLGIFALMVVAVFASSAAAQSPSGPVYNSATQSYYQLVLRPGLTWQQAYDAALALPPYAGRQPRLVTVTSYAEDRFLIGTYGNQLQYTWIGARRNRGWVPGPWQWVNGETFSYTNWSSGEPNNTAGKEDTIQYWPNGPILGIGWCDISQNATQARGFVVEYPRGR
jgi:hypothetical protein